MSRLDHTRLEELLAGALAAFDEGGEPGLAAFLERHAEDRPGIERGLQRCRQMGLLGASPPARDFPERLGEFRLLRRLGSGGMGVVYEAEQESLGRHVALKVVRPELLYFEGARERFRREIEAVARLSHPAVVPVLASGEQEGLPWYAMELLHGRTVHEVCNQLAGREPATLTAADLRTALGASTETGTDPFTGPWWQLCARITHAVALGVRHAHLRGIVHRDIKPSNIMLTADGRTVLLDFGVAMVGGGREFTRTGNTPGSPAFMSPEQLRGDAVDERTDVYSLAATLWQMLTLTPPFPAKGDLARAHGGDPPSAHAKNRQVPRELELVVRTAMDPDRERRYPDAEAFAEDLQAVLQRRPIRARRLGMPLRTWRWCQRHRVTATITVCALVGVLAMPAALAWNERDANIALAEAAQREREVNQALTASNRTAEASLDLALDAIYGMLVRVSDNRLRYVPATAPIAKETLRDACTMYRSLRAKHPEHERLAIDSSMALTRFGELLTRAGDYENALAAFREGLAATGTALQPPMLLEARAVARCNLANLLRTMGRRGEATTELDAASKEAAALPEDAAMHVRKLRAQCQIELELAYGFDPMTEAAPAEQHLRQAVAFGRNAIQPTLGDMSDQAKLVSALDTLGTLLGKNERYDDADPLLAEALAIAQGIPTDAHIWPPPPAVLADVLETIGNGYVARRDLRCVDPLKECLELREKLVADFPHDVEFRSDLAAALHNLAEMNFQQAQDELVLERLDRAISLQRAVLVEAPTFDQAKDYLRNHLTLRGSTLAQLGRRDELVATATELGGFATDPAALRSAARLWLRATGLLTRIEPPPKDLATQRAAGLRRAMDLLLAAERLGWGPHCQFEQKVYDPLRGMAEFEALQQRRAAAESQGRRSK